MIVGIGIDSVEIARLSNWSTKPHVSLLRILSEQEIAYCLAIPTKSAERFAARFAAREAFFKAWRQAQPTDSTPFLTICKKISVAHSESGSPLLLVDWSFLEEKPNVSSFIILLSITHTGTSATAIVLIQQSDLSGHRDKS